MKMRKLLFGTALVFLASLPALIPQKSQASIEYEWHTFFITDGIAFCSGPPLNCAWPTSPEIAP